MEPEGPLPCLENSRIGLLKQAEFTQLSDILFL